MNQFVAFPPPPKGGSLHTSAYQRTMNRVIAGFDNDEDIQPYSNRLDEAPFEIQEKARTLAVAMSELCNAGNYGYNDGGKKFFITHPKLKTAVLANPDRIKEYAEFCADRSSADALDDIDMIQPSIRSGLL